MTVAIGPTLYCDIIYKINTVMVTFSVSQCVHTSSAYVLMYAPYNHPIHLNEELCVAQH